MKIELVLLGVLALGVGVVLLYLDRIVGGAIETAGEQAFGVRTRVGIVTLRPIVGRFGLTSFQLDNPPGFRTPYFLRLGSARLDVAMADLRESPIVISRVELSGIDVHLERGKGKTNYGTILGGGKTSESGDAPSPVVIRELVIRDVQAHLTLGPEEEQRTLDVDIPPITLSDVGGSRGIKRSEMVALVTRVVLEGVLRNSNALPDLLRAELRSRLGNLPAPPRLSRDLGDTAEDTVRKVGERAGDLLRGVLGGDR